MVDSMFAKPALYEAVLNRMNITWEPDAKLEQKILDAMEEAQALLQSHAGNYDLAFDTGEWTGLFVACTWYLAEGKRSDFLADYGSELIMLRMTEGFGCGKQTENPV